MIPKLSVVVPVAPGDHTWLQLLNLLDHLTIPCELILAACFSASPQEKQAYETCRVSLPFKVSYSPQGRARQLNEGFRVSRAPLVWFLHADSRMELPTLRRLEYLVSNYTEGLYYFDLRFNKEKLWNMTINEWGVKLRSRLFKLPFGDQGFLLTRNMFLDLGCFDEKLSYGEDHLLIWRCHQKRIPVRFAQASLMTSARKYEQGGWFATTKRHVYLTFKQAVPEFKKLMRSRWND